MKRTAVLLWTACACAGCSRMERMADGETSAATDTIAMTVDVAIVAGQHPAADSFGLITSVAVDGAGNMYASDRMAAKIWLFDRTGALLGSIGREGDGPGEFKAPTGLGIGPDGLLYVRDQDRVTAFGPDASGALTELSHTFRGPLYPNWTSMLATRFDSEDRLYYPGYTWDEDGRVAPFAIRFTLDGDLLDTLFVPRQPTAPLRIPHYMISARTGRMLMGLQYVPFASLPVWAVTAEGTFVSGAGSDYVLRETDESGDTLAVFARAIEPEPIPRGERSDSLAALSARVDSIPVPLDEVIGLPDAVRDRELPSSYPFLSAVQVGVAGRVWVRRWIPESLGRTVYDVFDRDGTLRVTVTLPAEVLAEPTPVLSMEAVVAVIRNPLTDENGLVRFVAPR